MECPVKIHKVTDASPYESGEAPAMQCPVPHNTAQTETPAPAPHGAFDEVADEFSHIPSVQEYRKLRRVMGMITKFYRDGSNMKKMNYDTMTEEIAKLEVDENMVKDQIASLESATFKGHPKRKDYMNMLKGEMENMLKQKETFLAKQKECRHLWEWSGTIVQVCEWLELALDDYCSKTLLDLPEQIKRNFKPVPVLPAEDVSKYSKGLDEITYNLSESQDFFQASLDGRLKKYHGIEQQIIEAQLAAIRKYPEDNARRMFVEAELVKDLEYVEANMVENAESIRRKQKMLQNHAEFFQVLKFHRDRLHLLPEPDAKIYDSKFDHYKADA